MGVGAGLTGSPWSTRDGRSVSCSGDGEPAGGHGGIREDQLGPDRGPDL